MKFLFAEDEVELSRAVCAVLRHQGDEADPAYDGEEALRKARAGSYDCMVFDVMMPRMDGISVVRALRADGDRTPMIILTAKTQIEDKITGLDAGADDYITKPFNPRELAIRARNLLQRTMTESVKADTNVEYYRFNGWTLDINKRSLINPEGEEFKLPRSEFRAMLHFCENPGKIQTREDLLKKMTGRELKPQDRTVDVTIRRIRKHFEDHPDSPEIIATIHGEGYRFCGELE